MQHSVLKLLIKMDKILKKLRISQKLNFLGYVGVIGLFVSSIAVWFVLKHLHQLGAEKDNYAEIRETTAESRVNYNTLRSDLLLLFIFDKSVPEQLEKANKTIEHYNGKFKSIKENQSEIIELTKNDDELKPLGEKLSSSLGAFADLSTENFNRISALNVSDSAAVNQCKDVIFNKFDPIVKQIRDDKDALYDVLDVKSEKANEEFEKANKNAIILIVLITLSVLIIVAFLSRAVSKNISNRLQYVKDTLNEVSIGELPDVKVFDDKDEIGDMSQSFTQLVVELNKLKQFTVAVGTGNYDTDITVFNNKGEISNALLGMKSNLKVASDLKNIQNYLSEGLAKFATILRNDNTEGFYDNLISNLVRYVNVCQGAIFILEEKNNTKLLNRVATYAYDKKKFVESTFEIGEGLAGQCALEGDMIYLTEVPQSYIQITSGLGDANPNAILMMPLKVNDEVVGVLELASFRPFEKHEIDFVYKVSENIASSVISAKTNQRTKELLQISQQQTEEMRAQEEEMRQNMEEMQATQEEMERKELEMNKILEHTRAQEIQLQQTLEEMQATQEETERIAKAQKENDAQTKKIYETEINTMYDKWYKQLQRMEAKYKNI